jgi:hypothetical protein
MIIYVICKYNYTSDFILDMYAIVVLSWDGNADQL